MEKPSLRVVSWNVNGLRAVLKNTGKDLRRFLDSLEADIICLQETKATKDQLDSSLYQAEGYNGYFSFCRVKSGYSGVVTFCRDCVTPLTAGEGLTGTLCPGQDTMGGCEGDWSDFTTEELTAVDAEGRAVITEHQAVWEGGEGRRRVAVVNVYCPMVDGDNSERLDYKLRFYAALQRRCRTLHKEGKLVIAVGDLNCSWGAIDSAYIQDDPSLLDGRPERKWLQQFAMSSPPSSPSLDQLVDTYRCLHPSQGKAYTCWSTVLDCRKTNHGTRIDYILVSPALVSHLRQAEVWAHVEGSDHCPVYAELGLKAQPAARPPPLCSSYFSELKQQKLSMFLSTRPINDSKGTDSSKASRKRSLTSTVSSSAKVKRTSQAVGKGQTLLTMFRRTDSRTAEEGSVVDGTGDACSSQEETVATMLPDSVTPPSLSSQLSEEWRNVFSGPPKPPLCRGHQEPCVLRTVKKAGPNKNRQFWSCARPGGSKEDRAAKCNHFSWAAGKGRPRGDRGKN